jgi:ankyrin repeat protein
MRSWTPQPTAKAQVGKSKALGLLAEHDSLVVFAERLIEGGAMVDKYALHIACLRGSVQIARRLITAGSQVDELSSGGSTPLHFACTEGRAQVATLLLAEGAIANYADEYGSLPSLHAVSGGHTETTSVFIAAGGDVNAACGTNCERNVPCYLLLSSAMTNKIKTLRKAVRKVSVYLNRQTQSI